MNEYIELAKKIILLLEDAKTSESEKLQILSIVYSLIPLSDNLSAYHNTKKWTQETLTSG